MLKANWQMLRGPGGACARGYGRVSLVFSVTKCKEPTQWGHRAAELLTPKHLPCSALDITRLRPGPGKRRKVPKLSPPRHKTCGERYVSEELMMHSVLEKSMMCLIDF